MPLKRLTSVIAIEFCEIYIIDFVDLKKFTQMNKVVMDKLRETAHSRLEMTLQAEEDYKNRLDQRMKSAKLSFDVQ